MKPDKCETFPHHKWFGLALQAMVILSDKPCAYPSACIASCIQSEASLVRRVLAKLVKEGLVETREGRDGGYQLGMPAERITLADVYCALRVGEPLCNAMADTTGSNGFGTGMKAVFENITEELEASALAVLKRTTIADLAERVGQTGQPG
ncbi:hypothetical protein J31TS4_27830 [Paenibacillus sp. J31TS4]|uniref:RrF2 family transcriptional regulator n=1 Tax=Paenibacillus sp. J31TS4 TaxID=2807195 RepID=UPI001B1F5894|nr:Rrf2 family transcriptional regulator [Paenibacillus sp. J31TS4]GIP39503.1 hypothetical protein J31TS4_27830 [Paenibacillus sp. J31TS4]